MKSNLIKNQDFWTMHIAQDFSWCWRRIFEHRELAKTFIGVVLGDGADTIFLYDSWHPRGKLVDWIEPSILEIIWANNTMVVADFISNGEWNFSDFMEDEAQNVITHISSTEFNIHEKDQLIWNPSATGEFSIKSTYHSISSHNSCPIWNSLVWFKGHIPRHSFITWLAIHKRLKTKSKLLK